MAASKKKSKHTNLIKFKFYLKLQVVSKVLKMINLLRVYYC